MKLIRCKLLSVFIIVFVLPGMVVAESDDDKAGSAAFKFLNLKYSARGAALGGLAAQAGGAEAIFWNPAGIASANGIDISAGMTQWFVETSYMNFGAVMPLAGGVAGVSFVSVNYGDIMKSGWSGSASDGTLALDANMGSFSASDVAMGLTYGRNFSDKFSVGGTAKMITENIDNESFGGLSFDVGMQFHTGYRGISLGAVITNFGPDVDPLKIPEGSTYTEFPAVSLPMTFSFGVVGEAMSGLEAGINVVKSSDMAQRFAFSGEYSVADIAQVRGSYTLGDDQAPISLGAGVNVAGVTADLGMTMTTDFGTVIRISIGYSL